jgi:hypothetical protein
MKHVVVKHGELPLGRTPANEPEKGFDWTEDAECIILFITAAAATS